MSLDLDMLPDERTIVEDICRELLLPSGIDDIDLYIYKADDLARRVLKALGHVVD